MSVALGRLAELAGGTVAGNPERQIRSIRTLEDAGPDDLSLLINPRYRKQAATTRAGALLVAEQLSSLEKDQLIVADPSYALSQLLPTLHPVVAPSPGVHPTAVIGEGCEVDPSAHIGPFVVIGDGSRVEPEVAIYAHATVGRNCSIGRGTVLHPQVVLYDDTTVGERCILHSGAVLGSDGFGFATHHGVHVKIPQVGRVEVGADVEIGANSAVDRAALAKTRIGDGTKIDNLVQVGHNVTIGRHCLLVAQVGISGSTRLGDGVVMAGRSGAAGHLELGDGVQVATRSVVTKSVPPHQKVAGFPAVAAGSWRRQQALLKRLDEMYRRLKRLERRLGPEEE